MKQLGIKQSGLYWIDPDGVGVGMGPVEVWCDMRSGHTRVGHQYHDQEAVLVTKCQEPGCSVHKVDYDLPMRQIEALILMSGQCEQYVR